MTEHPDVHVGDRVRLAGTKSERNTGIAIAIKSPGTTKTRVIVRPDTPTPAMEHIQENAMMRPPAPDIVNPNDLWDCAMGELEVIEKAADVEARSVEQVLHFETETRVIYNGNLDDIWVIVQHEPDAKYAYCARSLTREKGTGRLIGTGKAKNIVAALLTPYIDTRKARRVSAKVGTGPKAPPREKKRKDNIGDGISDILAEAETLTQLWQIAELAGMNVAEVKARIGHLNPGLQRMGIGNRLRHAQKQGNLTITVENVMAHIKR